MTASTSTSLPAIPLLPPLEMPDPSLSPSPTQHPYDSPAAVSSTASVTSRESFSTAYTSSPIQLDPREMAMSPPGLSTLAPPQSLRKSLSVDSFVKYGHNGTRQDSSHSSPTQLNANMATDPSQVASSSNTRRERERALFRIGRSRGSSVSTMEEEFDQSLISDSDIERSESLSRISNGYARTKGLEPKPFVRGGELSLPSRAATIATSNTSSHMSGTTASHDGPRRLHASSSLQTIPRNGGSPTTSDNGRARSGSLGVHSPSVPRRMLINTKITTSDSQQEVVLVVIGAVGCGKSMAIRKGLKVYNLSEPSAFSSIGIPGASASARYTRRIGHTRNDSSPDRDLHVLEVDTAPDTNETAPSRPITWPKGAPQVDGVVICYDASNESSFLPVESLLRNYHSLKLPTIVLACKSELEHQVVPHEALSILKQYDAGLVEVTTTSETGKEKLRRSFEWLLRAIFRERRNTKTEYGLSYRNPASPDVLISPAPWENSRTVTPTAHPNLSSSLSMSSVNSMTQLQPTLSHPSPSYLPTIPPSRSPSLPNSPTRARSMSDLLSEHEKSKNRSWEPEMETSGSRTVVGGDNTSIESFHGEHISGNGLDSTREDQKSTKEKESRPGQWATLEELLDKLLFLAISGDDPAFVTHFLLTYRRFATTRSVLLAMQKRMRQLDNPSGDPMFACFAQMRICHLLEQWTQDYPHDFASQDCHGALSALIKSIISKTYLLHYGSDLLPFFETLPSLQDQDASWALKVTTSDESDDDIGSDDGDVVINTEVESVTAGDVSPTSSRGKSIPSSAMSSRERKSSLPLSSKGLISPGAPSTLSSGQADYSDTPQKQLLKDLVRVAQEVNALDSEEIAQEITRIEARFFLDIKPRHWLQYTFVPGAKDPETDYIARFNRVSNHLADWVVSLILCHDRPKARAKQIDKFVDVARELRALNNYSALRAFVAGINNSTFSGDQAMEEFRKKTPEQAKHLQSWDLLLQHLRSHRNYRMALRHTKGACIPALEVHMSDLIKAHEGNPDFNSADATKIHWGKFNMMGKFITGTTQCQIQCRTTNSYKFPERRKIGDLLLRNDLMNDEMQKSRIAPPDLDAVEDYRPALPRTMSRDGPPSQSKDVALLRKLIFW